MRWIDSLSLIGCWTAGSATVLTLIYILFTIWLLLLAWSLSRTRILLGSSQCIFCRDFRSDLMALERFILVIYRAMCALFMCVGHVTSCKRCWSRHANCKLNKIICATNLTLVCARLIALNEFSATWHLIIVSNSSERLSLCTNNEIVDEKKSNHKRRTHTYTQHFSKAKPSTLFQKDDYRTCMFSHKILLISFPKGIKLWTQLIYLYHAHSHERCIYTSQKCNTWIE